MIMEDSYEKHSTYGIVTKQSIIYESHEQRIAYR